MQRTLATTDPPPASQRPAGLFEERHRALLELLRSVKAAVASVPTNGEVKLRWVDFTTALTRQLDEEDRELIPFFADSSERDVRVLVHEHRHIRDQVKELDAAVGEHLLRLSELNDFAAILRAHFRNEERMLARRLAVNDNG
jgi:hypothetical protein